MEVNDVNSNTPIKANSDLDDKASSSSFSKISNNETPCPSAQVNKTQPIVVK